ncbi:glycosyltransferase [bacterium]|nr:glycosyltransferase [bacterium]
MKILFINGFSKNQVGGESKVAEEISHYFSQDNTLDVGLIRSGEETEISPNEGALKVFSFKAYNDNFISISRFSGIDLLKLRTFLREFQPDVIHCHTIIPFVLFIQAWANINKVPFIYTTHALPNQLTSFVIQSKIRFLKMVSSIIDTYAKVFYNNCNALICLNQAARDELIKTGYKGPIYTIPNGRDLKRYYKPKDISLEDKIIHLTFVGYLDRRKNQHYLVDALQYLPKKYHLHLIGTSDNKEYVQKIKTLIHKLKLYERVTLHGNLPHTEVIDILNQSYLFVSASTKEVQSLAILETLASGTPIVGLSNETVDEFVNKDTGIWLNANSSPKEFAKSVEHFTQEKDSDYENISKSCLERVSELDWSNIQTRTVETYEEILKLESKKSHKRSFPSLILLLSLLIPLYPLVYWTTKSSAKRKQRKS